MTSFCHVDFTVNTVKCGRTAWLAWLNSETFRKLFPHLIVLQLGQTCANLYMINDQKQSKAGKKTTKNGNNSLHLRCSLVKCLSSLDVERMCLSGCQCH